MSNCKLRLWFYFVPEQVRFKVSQHRNGKSCVISWNIGYLKNINETFTTVLSILPTWILYSLWLWYLPANPISVSFYSQCGVSISTRSRITILFLTYFEFYPRGVTYFVSRLKFKYAKTFQYNWHLLFL